MWKEEEVIGDRLSSWPGGFNLSNSYNFFSFLSISTLSTYLTYSTFSTFLLLKPRFMPTQFSQESLVDLSSISARTDGEEDER